jgi:hypothetical protein
LIPGTLALTCSAYVARYDRPMANTRTGPERTAAAVAANRRRRQERLAAELREAGWSVTAPEAVRTLAPAGARRVEFRA